MKGEASEKVNLKKKKKKMKPSLKGKWAKFNEEKAKQNKDKPQWGQNLLQKAANCGRGMDAASSYPTWLPSLPH